MTKNCEIRIVRRWEDIYSDTFKKEWLDCYNHANNSHVFFHPSLCLAWIDTYKKLRHLEPAFCLAKMKDVKILFPLILWKQNWKNACRKIIIPVGYSDFDYHDPLVCGPAENYNPESFFISLIELLDRELSFDLILLNGIRTKMRSKYLSKESEIAPYCELESYTDSMQLLKYFKPSLRGDIRRQMRRIAELGEMRLEVITDCEIALNILPEFLSNHTKRWPNSYKAPHLHENIIKQGLEVGVVHFSILRCNDVSISWHMGFVSGERFYYYMPVIAPEFEAYSPGKIHLFKLTELSLISRLKVFDHLRGEENYKAGWTNNFSQLYKIKVIKKSPLSITKEVFCSIKNSLT